MEIRISHSSLTADAPKPIRWIGRSLEVVRSFPGDVRRKLGEELRRVQEGLRPKDWKPMRTVGKGAVEICVHAQSEYRAIYVARFAEAIYVLHAFEKRTRKTAQSDLDTARRRLTTVIRSRANS